jgi:hypothetical protein
MNSSNHENFNKIFEQLQEKVKKGRNKTTRSNDEEWLPQQP